MAFAMALGKFFQLTTSRRGRPVLGNIYIIICFFQLTTSRRGRRLRLTISFRTMLSTHDLTQRSTMPDPQHPNKNVFQLTTSRRGRRDTETPVIYTEDLSTHDLTQRSTEYPSRTKPGTSHFQLTTSRRGRRFRSTSKDCEKRSFNSRPHAEVDCPSPADRVEE